LTERRDIKPASDGVSQRHRTIPPVCRCRPRRREQFGGAGSGPDAGSRGRTQETGGICIQEIRQARTNYPVFLAKMQAAVFGMDHFLITGRFALYADHRPLCKLSLVHVKRLNKLQLKMTEFHPDIKYIEGKNNVMADFLSRYHGMNIPVTDVKYDKGRVNAAVAALSHGTRDTVAGRRDAIGDRIPAVARDPAVVAKEPAAVGGDDDTSSSQSGRGGG
jgi:hypothetical protein